jgi:hypothetical protein
MKKLRVAVLTEDVIDRIDQFLDDVLDKIPPEHQRPEVVSIWRTNVIEAIKKVWKGGTATGPSGFVITKEYLRSVGLSPKFTERAIELTQTSFKVGQPVIMWRGLERPIASIPEIYYYEPFETMLSGEEVLHDQTKEYLYAKEEAEEQAEMARSMEELERALTQMRIASTFGKPYDDEHYPN